MAGLIEARQRGEDVAIEEVFALDLAGVDTAALARAGEPLSGHLGSVRSAQFGDRFRKRSGA